MAASVAKTVLGHPDAPPTLSWLVNPTPPNWDLDEPWWTSRAVTYLGTHLTRGDRVWEWGSGGSTVWLVEQGAKLTSIEDDSQWAAKVQQRRPGADVRLYRRGLMRFRPCPSSKGGGR